MTSAVSTPYARRIQELKGRTRHKVRRRLLLSLAAQNVQYAKIVSILDWVSALFRECERRHTHGALPLAYAHSLGPARTIRRYLELALASCDPHGYPDFVIDGGTLHIPQMRHDKADMARAEAKWARERELARERKRRQRTRQSAQAAPSTRHSTPPSEAFCEMSRSDSSLREEDLREDKDKASAELCALAERMEALEAAEALAGVGSNEPPEWDAEAWAKQSAALSEAAYREIETERAKQPIRAPVEWAPLRGQLTAWGYDAARAARHRFTEQELCLAAEKVERAHTPLQNRAGAVVATILRWRTHEWRIAS